MKTQRELERQLEAVPPHDPNAEAGVLGSMLASREAAAFAVDALAPADFYLPACRLLFDLFSELHAQQPDLDIVYVNSEIQLRGLESKVGGPNACGRLLEKTPTPANVERYCRIVKARKADRDAQEKAAELLKAASQGRGMEALGTDATREGNPLAVIAEQLQAERLGTRTGVAWPMNPGLSVTQALIPATVTVLCGSPGASKSLFIVECLWRWFELGWSVTLLALESGVSLHLRRAMAQMAGRGQFTNLEWVNTHPTESAEVEALVAERAKALMAEGVIQSKAGRWNWAGVLRWIRSEALRGRRVICIDPVTIIAGGARPWDDHADFVAACREIADGNGCNIVCVTHPVKGAPGIKLSPGLENMSGGRAWQQFVDSGLWLEAHSVKETSVAKGMGITGLESYERTLHVVKARLGAGSGMRLAMTFDTSTLWHREVGRIIEAPNEDGEKRKTAPKAKEIEHPIFGKGASVAALASEHGYVRQPDGTFKRARP